MGAVLVATALAARATAAPYAMPATPDQHEAVETYLSHIYATYYGVRACSELSTELGDHAYGSAVTYDEARKAMREIESAATEVGFAPDPLWAAAAPKALVTAAALKRSPRRLALCQRIGDIFRDDEANLQNLLGGLGARQAILPKGF